MMRLHAVVAVRLLTVIVVLWLAPACRGDLAPEPERPPSIRKRGVVGATPQGSPVAPPTIAASRTESGRVATPTAIPTAANTSASWSEGLSLVVDRISASGAPDVLAIYRGGTPHAATVHVGPETRIRHVDGHRLGHGEVQVGDLLHVVGEPLGIEPQGIRAGWILVVPWHPPRNEGIATEAGHGPAHTIVAVVAAHHALPDFPFEELRLAPPHEGWIVQIVPGIPVEDVDGSPVRLGDIRPGDRVAVAGGAAPGSMGDGDPLYAGFILVLDR